MRILSQSVEFHCSRCQELVVAKNLRSAFSPLLLMSTPLGLSLHSGRRPPLIAYALLLVIFYSSLWAMEIRSFVDKFRNAQMLSTHVPSLFYKAFHFSTTLVAIIAKLVSARSDDDFIVNVENADKYFIDPRVSYKKIKTVLILVVILISAWYVAEIYCVCVQQLPVTELLFLLTSMTNLVMCVDFVTKIVILRSRFRLINDCFISMFGCKKHFPRINEMGNVRIRKCRNFNPGDVITVWSRFQNDVGQSAEDLQKSHHNLVQLSERVAKECGVFNVCTVLEATGTSVILVLMVLVQIFSQSEELNLIGSVISFGAILRSALKIVAVSVSCHTAASEANSISELSHELHLCTLHSPNADTSTSVLDRTKSSKLKFTACGLFAIDATLISTVFATVVTYTIILVQFAMAEADGKPAEN